MNTTEELARYALELNPDDVPSDVLAMSRTIFADTVGVLLASSQQRAVATALTAFPPADGACTVVGHGRGATPEQAAFINGVGGHDVELDDLHTAGRTHAAAVLVPAAIAAVEAAGGCRGRELLTAIVAGYDVQLRVIRALVPQRAILRGFHPTAIGGPIGAAVVAGRLLGLSTTQLRHALALAASEASGLMTYRDDTAHMIKSFQTGIAARNGLYAALLAKAGYEGAPDVLTGTNTMLLPFGGPDPRNDELLADLGTRFEITETSLKLYACCGHTHSSLDALLEICRDEGLSPDDIVSVDVRLAHDALPIIDANPLWTHNLQYCMAVAAHEGTVNLEHFAPEWTGRDDLLDLAGRIHLTGDDRLQEGFPDRWGTQVTVRTTAGEHQLQKEAPRGSPFEPLTDQEVRDKFLRLAQPTLEGPRAEKLYSALMDVAATDDLGGVLALLVPGVDGRRAGAA